MLIKKTIIMNLNKPSLIGIKGFKGSGKDTVASMISYILYVGTTKANFDSWHVQYQADIVSNSEIIIHFADKLKDDIADLCGINRCLLDNRLIKETHYYNFATGIVSMNTKDSYHVIDEVPTNLSHLLALNGNNVSIKIRTLLQYYGTEVIRSNFWQEAFIRYTINKAFDVIHKEGHCIIADVRFDNECEAIKKYGGVIIRIDRKVNESNDNHKSEKIKISQDDYVITNDATLMGLFYKVLGFVINNIV